MEKVGFHYRPDYDGYTEDDLALWLPKLKEIGVTWVVLLAPVNRTIPEFFIAGLKEEGIEPVLHFQFSPEKIPNLEEMILMFENYQKWGVKYTILFDRPNIQENWESESWAGSNLTERFLDVFLPLAEAGVALGLVPVFPPLEPGGDYWDMVFLRRCLDGIKRRGSKPLHDRLLLSVYAGLNQRSLSWGAGGPESWPEAQPYDTPESSEDQRGFRIAEWYLTLTESIFEKRLPILMLGIRGPAPEGQDLSQTLLDGAKLISRQEIEGLKPLPEEVLGGAFWVLTADESCCAGQYSWYYPDGRAKQIVDTFLKYDQETVPKKTENRGEEDFRISHYLLLPKFEWGVADWHLEVTRSFVKRHQPTIGFSLEEATRADQVTVLGGKDHFSDEDINHLRNQGCLVRRIDGDGPKVASMLAAI